MPLPNKVVITCFDVTSSKARALLREYFIDAVTRYHGALATVEQVDDAMTDEPRDRLAGGLGVFLVARRRDELLGCIGLRELGDGCGEIKRMYVRPAAQGLGIGAGLLSVVEGEARDRGWREVKLDTRSDLAEARSLYESRGYVEIPVYNANPYAQHWYSKPL